MNKFHRRVQSCMDLVLNFKVCFTPPHSETDFIWLIYTTHPWKRAGWSLHHVCNLTLQLYTPYPHTHPPGFQPNHPNPVHLSKMTSSHKLPREQDWRVYLEAEKNGAEDSCTQHTNKTVLNFSIIVSRLNCASAPPYHFSIALLLPQCSAGREADCGN